ncbi:MAG: peptidoglycan-binding protein [Rhodospirillales bacterium]|nr:peptidoglycan-binding protein [Rhodospirillales bacterium]
MSDFMIVMGLALLPGFGNFLGGLLAEAISVAPKRLNQALHAAAGIMIAVVAVELIPRALENVAGWLVAGSFLAGGLAMMLVQAVAGERDETGGGPWVIYLAVATDLFSDGLMLGSGSAVSSALAVLLALGQVLADVPEGFAAMANFRDAGMKKSKRLLLSISFFVPVMAAAAGAYLLLRDQSDLLKYGALSFISGMLLLAAAEDMMNEAHESSADTRASSFAFLGGFALFTLVSSAFG